MSVQEKSRSIRLILSDVDGILTDGIVEYDNRGIETKRFHVRDGLGIKLWQKAGYRFGMITARSSRIVKIRAAELGIDFVRQGVVDKLAVVGEAARLLEIPPAHICFIGDDFPDWAPMQTVGLSATVPEAPEELRETADYVTSRPGGRGAVRDLIETILKHQRRWEDVIQQYRREQ